MSETTQTLADLREANGYTQAELAHRCDISATALSHIENGIYNYPSLPNFAALARELDVEMEDLYLLLEQRKNQRDE